MVFARSLSAALCGSACMAALAFSAGTARAAEAQPAQEASAANAGAGDGAGGEIVVTATRREQALQNVPIAVTALGSATLRTSGVNSSAGLAQLVPNLNITAQPGSYIIYLRGVGQQAINPGQEPSVATYVDGVYQPTVFGALTSLANIQRLEVIKGPQGTLFGRNATGGLINITTRDPSQDTHGELSASYGNFRTARLIGYFTTGIAEGAAIDFSGYWNHQGEGWGTNVTTGNRLRGTENLDLRSKLLLDVGPNTKIRLAGSYTRNTSSVGNALTLLPGSIGIDGSTALPGFYDIQSERDPYSRNTTFQFSGKVEQDLGFADLISITSYTKTKDRQSYDNDTTKSPIVAVDLSDRNGVFTQELQLASKKGSALTWILGAFYYKSDAFGRPTGTGLSGLAFAPLGGVNARAVLKTQSIAVYGEGTYEILPKLNLTIGGRYTSDRKKLSGDFQYFDTDGTIVSIVPVEKTKKTFNEPTYRAILDYKFSSQVMSYASYSRGFKSGGYDTGFPTGVAFKPETIDAYEVGLKTQLFERRLRLNVAAFYYDYKNLQLPVLVTANGVSSQVTVNAANSTVKGIDLDGSLNIVRGFDVNFGFGYLDGKYKNFTDAPCTKVVGGVTIQYACDASGNRMIHAPKTTFNLGASYHADIGYGELTLSANYSHLSKSYFDVSNRLAQPAYGLLNGQISLAPHGAPFTVTLFAENLTNKKYTAVQYAQDQIGDTYGAGAPRTYGVELRTKF